MKLFLITALLFALLSQVFPALSAQTSSAIAQIALSEPLTLRWQYNSDQTVNLTPAVAGERVYLPLAAGTIVSLRSTDGQMFWKTEIGGEVSASPVADERAVYIASETIFPPSKELRATGALRAMGREGGVTLWMRTFHRPLRGSLVTDGTALFGGTQDGRVFAVEKATGRFLWVMQHWQPFNSHPALYGSKLYIGSDDGNLFALNKDTGDTIWRYRTRGPVRGRAVEVEGVVYFGSADGYVYALNAADGRLRWRTRTGAGVQVVAEGGGGLLIASLDNFVYKISFVGGDRLWKRQLAGRVASEPLMARDGALFTPLSGDAGVVLDLRDGKQLNTLPVGEDNNTAASPVAVGGVLLVTTRQGLMAFSRPDTSTQSSQKQQ
ncbi:MAG TPA: PQQ-binding-like beta-propeller repeat protein [Pyrinomonadaceae bacterium]|nr:PQQ-binding-like beta-propeller repeat protein [Pyrinomonadaceae bacterium]